MKKYICILAVAMSMSLGHAYAHEDFYAFYNFGNVKVRIKTGFEYEEINKVAMFGQLAEKMCEELRYSKPVLLDFVHHYVSNYNPNFTISYDKVSNGYLGWESKTLLWNGSKVAYSEIGDFIQGDAIVIRQHASYFQAQITLKLLEYAILQFSRINSIDTLEIKKMLQTPNGDLINSVMNQKIYRPEQNFEYGISYYFQNNRYVIFQKSRYNKRESTIAEIDNIFDIKQVNNLYAIVFDSDTSFYYVKRSDQVTYAIGAIEGKENDPYISKKQVIEKKGHRSFRVTDIDDGTLAISSWYFGKKKIGEDTFVGDFERTMIYFKDEDQVIQDLDKLVIR